MRQKKTRKFREVKSIMGTDNIRSKLELFFNNFPNFS